MSEKTNQQKIYQQLSSKNLRAAENLWNALKSEKALSRDQFEHIFLVSRNEFRNPLIYNTIRTTENFLIEHGLVTKQTINGLIIYVATQKCFRTQTFKNATREIQVVTNRDIDFAAEYAKLNDNKVPVAIEAEIVGKILKLERDHLKIFIDTYTFNQDPPCHYLPIKFKVIGTIHMMVRLGIVKLF